MGGSGLPLVTDANLLYRELFDANTNLQTARQQWDELGDERHAVYDALKGVVGLGGPITPRNQERQVTGFLKHIFGHSPKFGTVQRKLLSTTTDLVGRAVITPDPELDMDEVGIPEQQAWDIYRPFVIRRLVQRGMPRMAAVDAVEQHDARARDAIVAEMDARPVILNRAPVLHRYGVMAFKPKLVKGTVVRLAPIVCKGFNADFDGDAMQFHVPAAAEAVQEAYRKLLPSRNLIAPGTFKVHELPSNEFIAGLYSATTQHNKTAHPRTFVTARDAMQAWQRGEISHDTPVTILQPSSA
jgi:DNA-directed RNA polymerase subunit beta'